MGFHMNILKVKSRNKIVENAKTNLITTIFAVHGTICRQFVKLIGKISFGKKFKSFSIVLFFQKFMVV